MKKPAAMRPAKTPSPAVLDVPQATAIRGGGWFNDWLFGIAKNSHPDAK